MPDYQFNFDIGDPDLRDKYHQLNKGRDVTTAQALRAFIRREVAKAEKSGELPPAAVGRAAAAVPAPDGGC